MVRSGSLARKALATSTAARPSAAVGAPMTAAIAPILRAVATQSATGRSGPRYRVGSPARRAATANARAPSSCLAPGGSPTSTPPSPQRHRPPGRPRTSGDAPRGSRHARRRHRSGRRPGLTERHESGHQEAVGDGLERAQREHRIERPLDSHSVKASRGGDEPLDVVVGRNRLARVHTRRVLGRRDPVLEHGGGRVAGRPTLVDEAPHRPQAGQGRLVVEPIAGCSPRRLDDLVSPLPRAQQRNGHARSGRGLFDGVHGSYRIHAVQGLTSTVHRG